MDLLLVSGMSGIVSIGGTDTLGACAVDVELRESERGREGGGEYCDSLRTTDSDGDGGIELGFSEICVSWCVSLSDETVRNRVRVKNTSTYLSSAHRMLL